jgi:hypothetical protein
MDAVEAHLAATDTMAAALERYGWRDLDRTDAQDCPLYERPDQEVPGPNGGLINKSGLLVVFSTSTPFESVLTAAGTGHGTTYNLLDVYAAYEHEGDRQTAARAIADQTGIYPAWQAEEKAREQVIFGTAGVAATGLAPKASPPRPRTMMTNCRWSIGRTCPTPRTTWSRDC